MKYTNFSNNNNLEQTQRNTKGIHNVLEENFRQWEADI